MSGLKRNIVATVPATLAEGHEVFVGSGSQFTHYIGNASNVPVPVKGYLEYSALLTQAGTSAPTAILLKNELNITPTFVRNGIGDYGIVLDASYSVNNISSFIQSNDATQNIALGTFKGGTTGNGIDITCSDGDDILSKTSLKVMLYT